MTDRRLTLPVAAVSLLLAFACGSGNATQPEQQFPDSNDPAYAASFDEPRDPRVSTSPGQPGGVVILWPRVVPGEAAESMSAEAEMVQARLVELTGSAFGSAHRDIRPSPQRVCPGAGCEGVSVGALLLHEGGGCAVVLWTSGPGRRDARLSPWAGEVTLRRSSVPFREPPESHVQVQEMVPCHGLASALSEGSDEFAEALADAARVHGPVAADGAAEAEGDDSGPEGTEGDSEE